MDNKVEVFIPGRLCILGEHSDWAAGYRAVNSKIEKGYAIVAGLNLGIYLRGYKSEVFYYEYDDKKLCLSCEELLIRNDKDFFEYVIASAKVMQSKYKVSGVKIICDKMTLPMKKGLASSAAICVAVIRVYNLLFDLKLSVETEMELAYEAETSTGSKCGKLDQVCAYGQGLRKIVFDSEKIEISSLHTNSNLQFILVNLQGEKETKKILSDLNCEFVNEMDTNKGRLINSLGEFNRCCVNEATQKLVDDDVFGFGHVMNKFQENFDLNVACYSEELRAPQLHRLINYCSEIENIIACKGVGSQGDGMAQILLDCGSQAEEIMQGIRDTLKMECYSFKTGQIDLNAIIPIAGKGTRMYPYTTIIDKAMLPVIDSGKVYPALSLILRELYFSKQIKTVNLIINEKQDEIISKLGNLLSADKIDVSLLCSTQIRRGFGGAIASSKFLNEPGFSMVCLGDYIYKGASYGDCTRQLVELWRKNNKSIVGIKAIPVTDTKKFGVVHGEWIDDRILRITKIVEKPETEYAKENLMIEYQGNRSVFAFFGQYIIDNDILRKMSLTGDNEEIGFSEFLNEYAQRQDMYAVVIQGDSYDLGNPKDYYSSFVEYGKDNV